MIDKITLAAAAAVLPGLLSAQWPAFPTPGVPKTSNGQPNLGGPAPRTADGKPDLSGIWDSRPAGPPPGPRPGGAPSGPPPPGPPPPPTAGPRGPFFNMASAVKGGLPFQPWAAAFRAKRLAENSKDHPDAHCLPINIIQLHSHPQPRKIVQTPGLVMIVYEGNGGLRQIFTDGRPLPGSEAQPWWYGYSVGKWEGDALVVESRGFHDNGWIDEEGTPMSDAAKVTERFRRVNFGTLEIEVTVDDPKVFTRPWSVTLTQRVMLNTDLFEFICLENQDITHLVGR